MKLLLVGDAAHTGFGRVGRELARRFLDAGVDLRWIAINWRGRDGEAYALLEKGAPSEAVKALLDEIDANPLTERMVPAAMHGNGQGRNLTAPAVFGALWPGWKPDMAIVVADPRAFLNRLLEDGSALSKIPTFNYVPIEGTGLPPYWGHIWDHAFPVAMCEFGAAQLTKLLERDVPIVYHGVSDGFRPVSVSEPGHLRGQVVNSKDAAKAAFGMADRTVLLRTDRFIDRKNYPALFDSMGPVLERHPEALLVIHCAPVDGDWIFAEQLSRMAGAYRIGDKWTHPQVKLTRMHDTFRGLDDEGLNVLYNAADIYVSPTMGEGFGLTLAEAAAAAVPVVTTDYASGPEVVGPGGSYAAVKGLFTNRYAHEWAMVDEQDFARKVEYLIEHPAKRRSMGQDGQRHVKQWTWDRAAAEFMDLFNAVDGVAEAAA